MRVRSNLAWLAGLRGRYGEAERGHRQVLETMERFYGPDHPSAAFNLHHLGVAVAEQDRLEEAEGFLSHALAIRENLGENHRSVAETLLELGRIVQRRGRLEEAGALLRRALEIRRKALPAGHSDLRRSADAVAAIEAAMRP